LIEWAVASISLVGESSCGDRHILETFDGGALIGAMDGLGHGPEAEAASAVAGEILSEHREDPVVALVQRCHESLRATRGVAMSLASVSALDGTMSWLGVGNVEASVLRDSGAGGPRRQSLVLRGGVVGYRLPRLLPSVVEVRPGDVILFATDGVDRSAFEEIRLSEPPKRIADDILARFARGTDDALALVVRYRGEAA